MLQPGDQIDIWVIEKQLGSGGMGSVYRCHNRTANRIKAAVKVLESSLQKHPEAQARFVREAEILFSLDHPNIVKVRNVRTDMSPPYLEMEFVEGDALENLLRKGPVPFDQCLSMMEQAASALAYLHRRGVRHRDIKPANLLVKRNGTLKLVDFGLAMEADNTRITQAGMAFGTVSYAPPEWIRPDELDPGLWDVYALGVVFYEMLTGDVAFPVSGQGSARQQAMQVIVAKQGHEPLDPGSQFHDDIRALVRAMTQAKARKRIQTADEVWHLTQRLSQEHRTGAGATLAPDFLTDEFTDAPSVVEDAPTKPLPRRHRADTWHESQVPAFPRQNAPSDAGHGRRVAMALLPGLLLGGILGIAVLSGLGLVAAQQLGQASERPVSVTVSGVPSDTKVDVRMQGQANELVNGFTFQFGDQPLGEVEIQWAVGEQCFANSCPGEACPEWCSSGTLKREVVAGTDLQIFPIELTLPEARPVNVKLGRDDAVATIGDIQAEVAEGTATFEGIQPGPHTLVVSLGECPEEQEPCYPDGECPDGCLLLHRDIAVAISSEPLGLLVELPAPKELPPAPVPTKAPTPTAAPKPTPSRGGMGRVVTVGAFADWLGSHETYHPENVKLLKWGDSGYLSDWNGISPTRPRSQPVWSISAIVANEYCKGRGGIASAGAGAVPKTDDYWGELRVDGGKFVLLDGSGATIPFNKPSASTPPNTGIRCAR